ncbi:TlpA disulfide reductase family protein [Butyricimonas faecalis]|uniref:AhpC/TSA family protein n=1 Tax=Butyricimonas faecalis TaxID=2093856 RepID=A0A3Q9IRP4_9BACT|nr:TlpA disulfide reductase family protein [Butyricimonas faecalis]AZS31128.1 AhpC/TSA family protein [Butyricimonas faecalis]
MKQIVIAFLIILGLSPAILAQEGFKITGRLGGSLGGNLVLVGSSSEGAVKLGETTMIDGNFEFSGSVEGVMPAYILTEEQQPIATVMLENLEYTLVAGESGIEVLGGGESQKIWNEFEVINRHVLKEKMKMEQEGRAAYAQQNQMKLQALQQQFAKIATDAEAKQLDLFKKYKDSFVSAFMIASGMQQMDYVSLKTLYDMLGGNVQANFYGQLIARQLMALKQIEPGSVGPDFQGVTAAGETITLHGVKAKVKLVDFWASWCGPCRQEMPNVSKIYKKYHELGLEIIGVSLDKKVEEWTKAMKEEKMEWLNMIDMESRIARLYFVRGIPHTILLDENNRIIAKDLRGKQLEKKIAELLKN